MAHISHGGRRGLAAATLLGLLAVGTACGAQTGSDPIASEAKSSAASPGQSDKALKADALRAGHGQLPSSQPAPAGKRVPDALP